MEWGGVNTEGGGRTNNTKGVRESNKNPSSCATWDENPTLRATGYLPSP